MHVGCDLSEQFASGTPAAITSHGETLGVKVRTNADKSQGYVLNSANISI
jgi:hypothetical protein